ncbi:MAG: hypothetical protein JXA54_06820 [Candidatus Heimdallarchaeota archaeon]|nr:hypothetical protein [Candidatus Heimdallarchaeota archaeon]
MSAVTSFNRKLPLSVSLGATKIFSLQEDLLPNSLSSLSPSEKQAFFLEHENFVLITNSGIKRPKVSQPNPTQMALVVRRSLAVRNQTNIVVLIVVNNRYEGKLIAEEFNRYASCFKVFSRNEVIKNYLHDDIQAKYQNDADFEILTYKSLWKLVTSRVDSGEELNSTKKKGGHIAEQIILLNPLRIRFLEDDLARLDTITTCLQWHKSKRKSYSFFFDESWFPSLTITDYQFLTRAKQVIFFRCSESVRGVIKGLQPQGILPYLNENQLKLFIFSELFRGRKTIKELLKRFQESFTYKFHLLSEGFCFENLNNLTKESANYKLRIDLKVYSKIINELNSYTKKYSKSLLGKEESNLNFDTGEINHSENIAWEETTNEPTKHLPLIYKGRDDNKYYLSALGEAVLATTTFYDNISSNFSGFLRYIETLLYRESKETEQLSMKEFIRFLLLLLEIKRSKRLLFSTNT